MRKGATFVTSELRVTCTVACSNIIANLNNNFSDFSSDLLNETSLLNCLRGEGEGERILSVITFLLAASLHECFCLKKILSGHMIRPCQKVAEYDVIDVYNAP